MFLLGVDLGFGKILELMYLGWKSEVGVYVLVGVEDL